MHKADTSLLIATGNQGKRREFEVLLSPLLDETWQVYDRRSWPEELPEVIEDADTFLGNAIKKALEPARQTGACVLSDDSGLVVDALGGRPGVYSARYAGPEAGDEANNQRLVKELAEVPFEQRSAHYVVILCLVLINNTLGRGLLSRRGLKFDSLAQHSEGEPLREGELHRHGDEALIFFEGRVDGKILLEPRGSGGFGYDPYFLIEAWNKTMAEVPLAQKNTISHRALATEKLLAYFSAPR